ncbi:MAG: hypothetical protein ABF461_05370 [Zymomonas mobilis subsp. pomaceae]|uniref:ElaB/YqjD/DUF883 family membrane-anchored ribosome-binding protein n=1 Tax=Zymomonas mobilis subsp. pomaceae (strain ATCC 29192 / DSM 22645 / JCM 10191 / CCUG 17912 / NBRC 13757 / NCIMB 11200 / NRRL B-4491 / Barker I) TaxID=579138 RepID=F8EVQ3_ZYMMT|nr:hypothetical protein [Zymomonas mobilis]AEI38390.1 hypothetical protein Zymop_1500 [Zymomonas mobilis subsp. pomaceae ATCC 29192]MDX5948080.1 hypothetical protein [Zymomonas mobilis subsp. pomaceae]GEB89409.1 hypothetical protein ZMO02_10460 [Zymomonas mobilis subsp. pomaceae]
MAENKTTSDVESSAKNAENQAEKGVKAVKEQAHETGHPLAKSASHVAGKVMSHLSDAKDHTEKKESKLHHLLHDHHFTNGKLHEIGEDGRHKAIEAVNNVAKIVDQTAELVAENFGSSYGDYMHKASKHIGKLSQTIKNKKLADLTKGGHGIIRRNPVVSAGVAAAMGYALYRFVSHRKRKCEENHHCNHQESSAPSSDSSQQDS